MLLIAARQNEMRKVEREFSLSDQDVRMQ